MPAQSALDYVTIAIAALVSTGFLLVAFLASRIFAPRRPSAAKAMTYECGIPPMEQLRPQIHIRYYLFAILFLIFDIEAVFLFPWALVFSGGGDLVFYEMIAFIGILFFGLVYAWRKGVLQWK